MMIHCQQNPSKWFHIWIPPIKNDQYDMPFLGHDLPIPRLRPNAKRYFGGIGFYHQTSISKNGNDDPIKGSVVTEEETLRMVGIGGPHDQDGRSPCDLKILWTIDHVSIRVGLNKITRALRRFDDD
jgi:hypothetical protein